MHIQTLHSVSTEYSADSVEWCTHPDFLEYFVCGTYQLEDNAVINFAPCRRKGRIYLFRYDKKKNELMELYRKETAAILDMKWMKQSTTLPILASANALGQIEIYVLVDNKLVLNVSFDINKNYQNLLALSIDWVSNENNSNELNKIIVSDSRGEISLLNFNGIDKLSKVLSWSAHNFEAWTCASDKWNEHILYTGGDDTFMHAFDIRIPVGASKIFTYKSHMAGVTSLLSHPINEHILLSGSYDEKLRIFDNRNHIKSLGEIDLKGGIWRIKSDHQKKNLILCACMYQNFSIVQLANSSLNFVEEYKEHESICYGADWCALPSVNNDLIMATCSFYDHKLCVSKVTI